jgi:uncharacterized delta-60 repeat protein
VAGSTNTGATHGFEIAVARYTAGGDPDPSFSGDGVQTTEIAAASANDSGNATLIQPDGKIVVAASTATTTNGVDFAVVRYMPNGDLDPSFDHDGIATTTISTSTDQPNGVAIQANGKLVLAGTANSQIGLVRYMPDGSIDSGFGIAGIVLTNATTGQESAQDVTIDSEGRIAIAGFGTPGVSGSDSLFARYVGDPLPEPAGPGPSAEQPAALPAAAAPGGVTMKKAGACAHRERGTRKGDRLVGTRAGDRLMGGEGNDKLYGGAGRDCLYGGGGNDLLVGGRGLDKLFAGPGRDFIKAVDGVKETIVCGPGKDRVIADKKDRLRGCERVTRHR